MSLSKQAATTVAKTALPVIRKYAGPAAASATAMLYKRLGWQWRAALTAGSLSVAAVRRLAGVRKSLQVRGGAGRGGGRALRLCRCSYLDSAAGDRGLSRAYSRAMP